MLRTRWISGVVLALAVSAAVASAWQGRGRGPQGPPDIAGEWTGTWTSFNPAQATAQPRELCKQLDATVMRFYTSAYATGYFNLTRK